MDARVPRAALPVALFAILHAPADNLVKNGGFEEGLAGWTVLDNSGRAKGEIDRKERKEGRQALRFSRTGGPPFDVVRTNVPDLPKGGAVEVSALVKAEKLTKAFLKFFVYDENDESLVDEVDLEELRGSFGWRKIEKVFEIPGEAKSGAVMVVGVGEGELWLDDVRVVPRASSAKGTGGSREKAEPPAPLDAATKAWLDENAVVIRTLDPKAPTADLAPLKELWKDVRVVQLGEQSHGDGATFRAKARLARFLHDEMGFDVLAFESGLYECDRANALFSPSRDPNEAMAASIFGIWRVNEAKPLFEHLAARAKSERPFLLAGFDARGSGSLAAEFLPKLFDLLEGIAEVPAADRAALRKIDPLLDEEPYAPAAPLRAEALAALERLRASFDRGRAAVESKVGKDEAEFFSRALDNYRARERFEFSKGDKSIGQWGSTNLRDAQMADNLRWLAEVRHPGKKIVAWGATMHLMRGSGGIRKGGTRFYEGCRPMGEATRETFGETSYTVGFVAHHGKAGAPWNAKFDLPAAKKGSVEDLLHRYGASLLFVDLRRKGPFEAPLLAGPLGYSAMEANWSTVLDGIFFTDEMSPSTTLR